MTLQTGADVAARRTWVPSDGQKHAWKTCVAFHYNRVHHHQPSISVCSLFVVAVVALVKKRRGRFGLMPTRPFRSWRTNGDGAWGAHASYSPPRGWTGIEKNSDQDDKVWPRWQLRRQAVVGTACLPRSLGDDDNDNDDGEMRYGQMLWYPFPVEAHFDEVLDTKIRHVRWESSIHFVMLADNNTEHQTGTQVLCRWYIIYMAYTSMQCGPTSKKHLPA